MAYTGHTENMPAPLCHRSVEEGASNTPLLSLPPHVLVRLFLRARVRSFSVCRHPSYAGWFWWSIGTQLLLCNPVCTLVYAAASYRFFAGRIWHEERALLSFFGDAYRNYQRQVPSGVPGVKGYIAQ